jgi:hypothetical protein
MRTTTALTLSAGLYSLTALAAPDSASAADVKRRGGQFEGMFGASLCIPGKGDCKSADTVSGRPVRRSAWASRSAFARSSTC